MISKALQLRRNNTWRGIASKLILPLAGHASLQHLSFNHGLCSIYQGGSELVRSSTQHSISFLVFYIDICTMPYQEESNLPTQVDIRRLPSKIQVIGLPANQTQFAAIISSKNLCGFLFQLFPQNDHKFYAKIIYQESKLYLGARTRTVWVCQ